MCHAVSLRRASRGQKAVCNPEICLEKKNIITKIMNNNNNNEFHIFKLLTPRRWVQSFFTYLDQLQNFRPIISPKIFAPIYSSLNIISPIPNP